jgi:5,5'-dehydrodivanillate O-demethylase
MITEQENELLTRVGPGTPGGELMRRYWHPIAVTSELERNPTKRVRLLGEDLVLYRDRSGNLGLIEPQCAHRRVDLFYGIPEANGIRCPYHGWMYDSTGLCIQQPYEEAADPDSIRGRVVLKAYPAQALGGLIWAYLGPAPAPMIPHWEPLVRENSLRDVGVTVIPCNWLQIMENSLDPVHTEWLHGAFTNYAFERQRKTDEIADRWGEHHKVGFSEFDYGIIKRRVTRSNTEDDDEWKRGHPILFPNILVVGALDAVNLQIRVPIDDEHTLHFFYTVNTPGIPVPEQEHPVLFDVPNPIEHENGAPKWEYLDTAPGQDIIAWTTQGSVARRDKERLGLSDTGIVMFRKMVSDNIQVVKEGGEPKNVFRDPAENVCINLQTELDHSKIGGGPPWKYSPLTAQVRQLFAEREKLAAR